MPDPGDAGDLGQEAEEFLRKLFVLAHIMDEETKSFVANLKMLQRET